jgi:predicted ribosomally synthesized peptide with SipW-like signal peptide
MASNDGLNLSRREILAGLGTVGVASAGAGVGTTAYFSDTENFSDNKLVAGELDLLVDWEEHYSDWKGAETDLNASMTEQSGYTPVPTADFPVLWVEDKKDFQDATAIESFPDTDSNGTANDGIQDEIPSDNECQYLKDLLRKDGEWISPLASSGRTNETVNGQTTSVTEGDLEASDPLIDLSDVKPGDFGEVTFSLHLCDNPGYIWMNGSLDQELTSENGVTEPEADDPDEDQNEDGDLKSGSGDPVVELVDELRAVVWYDFGTDYDGDGYPWEGPYSDDPDEGDNVQQSGEPTLVTHGTLRSVLTALNAGDLGIRLDADPTDGAVQVMPTGGMGTNLPGKTDWEKQRYEKPQQGIVTCADVNENWCTSKKLEAKDLPTGGGVQTYSTPQGMLAIQGFGNDNGQPYSIAFESTYPVVGVLVKGGPDSLGWTPDGQPYSSGTSGFDYDFASDSLVDEGDDSGDVTLTAPEDKGISNVQFCIEPKDDEPDNGDDDRDCFVASTTASIGFAWWLPVDHANEIQTDTVGFDLGFYTEQCRHNDGSGQPPESGS